MVARTAEQIVAARRSQQVFARVSLVLVLLVLAGLQAARAQGIYQVDVAQALARVPEREWQQRYLAAQRDYPWFAVGTLEEFIKINEYYRQFLADGQVVHRFTMVDGDEIYCIDVRSQAALRAAGIDPTGIPRRPASAPADPSSPLPGAPRQPSVEPEIPKQASQLDGSLDPDGNLRACPEGTFPKRIYPLQSLFRFKTFKDIFRKHASKDLGGGTPEGASTPAPPTGEAPAISAAGVVHEYAKVNRYYFDNKGLAATFNVWSPAVASPDEFSLAQFWVVGGSGAGTQTAETGWQVYQQKYGDNLARLFIYSTSDDYVSTGCYNLDCGRFVQTDNTIVLGGSFSNYSSAGGTQYDITLWFIRDDTRTHDWWLQVGGTWVGFYPNSLFNAAGIADKNSRLDYGGELVNDRVNGVDTTTRMGSGVFPSGGWQNAAFIRNIRYVDMNYIWADPTANTGLTGYTSKSAFWDVGTITYGSPNWSTYFFYGGPGNSVGTIQVNATLDGSPWPSFASGAVSYQVSGPSGFSGSGVPMTFAGKPVGTYTLTYVGGGPTGAPPQSITPAASQPLGAGTTTTFTMNFVTPPPPTGTIQVNATFNGSPWPSLGSGAVNYQVSGPSGFSGSGAPMTFTGKPTGTYTLSYVSGGPSGASLQSITPAASQLLSGGTTITFTMNFTQSPPAGAKFFTVTPCRLVDSRSGSPLSSGSVYYFFGPPYCNLPATAVAVSANVTVVGASGGGDIVLWPGNLPLPSPRTSNVSFGPGQTRAAESILKLAPDQSGKIFVEGFLPGVPGSFHVIVDVSGYFQ
jgi:hypothetical protein